MNIDNAIPIDIRKKIIINYWTVSDQKTKSMIDQGSLPVGISVDDEFKNGKEFVIKKPHVIYDEAV